MKRFIALLLSTFLICPLGFTQPYAGGKVRAADVRTDTSDFDGNLSSADNTLQKALETLDELVGAGTGDFLADGSIPMTGDINLDGNNIDNGGVVFLKEQADADADVAGSGQVWVDTATPNVLYFTDDAGTDFKISLIADTDYLTPGTAASTYQTTLVADTDYLTPGTAASTYQTTLVADTDYLTPGTAASTYQTTLVADTDYLTPGTAASTYAPIALTTGAAIGATAFTDLTAGDSYSNFGSASDDTVNELLAAVDTALGGKMVSTLLKDIVAGEGLSGGANDVLPGADADVTLAIDTAEIDGNRTWGAADGASIAWTWNLTSSDPTMTFGPGNISIDSSFTIGTAGVTLAGDGDGALRITGIGDGYDENVIINLDDTENTATVTSSTGLAYLVLSSISLSSTGYLQGNVLQVDDNTTTITVDVSDNMVFTDANNPAGVTLAALAAGGAAAGADTQIIYNNGGALDGDAGLTFDDVTKIVYAGGFVATPTDDAYITLDPETASESQYWIGINNDSEGDDDDNLEIRGNATAGNDVLLLITQAGNATLTGDLTITGDDLFMNTNTAGYILYADGTNFNPVDFLGGNWSPTGTWDFGSATVEIPNGTADVALTAAGQMHFNETDEQLSFHSGSNGEISGEASISLLYHVSIAFDPDAICDGAVDRVFLFTVGDDFPEGIIIDEWKFSFEADPTTEADIDLKRADAFIGVANAAVIDALDTTNGASSEDTDANINSGAAVANTKVLYLEFGTAYTETGHQCVFEMWFHGEED